MNIIGYGYVGKSIGALLARNNIMYQVNDPITKHGSFLYYSPDDLSKMIGYSESCLNHGESTRNYYFICVPTPSEELTGKCNTSIVFSVVKELTKYCKKPTTIIVKSTISPGTLEKLYSLNTDTYANVSIVFCPEFLRESYCIEDTLNASRAIIGLPQKEMFNKELTSDLEFLYKEVLYPYHPNFKVIIRTATICELFKYTINVHLAVKVWYFNEINEVCEKMNVPYAQLQSLFYLEPRLGSTHTDVPGHDGKYGFGLGCLPKETKSLTYIQKELNIPNNILSEITKRNENYFRRKSIA